MPVTENQRIPDIDEVVDAQRYADRVLEMAPGQLPLLNRPRIEQEADRLVEGGEEFYRATKAGLEEAGIKTEDPLELLLALRRIGGGALEQLFGPGAREADSGRYRPMVPASILGELKSPGGSAPVGDFG